jgi:hypothetical protein
VGYLLIVAISVAVGVLVYRSTEELPTAEEARESWEGGGGGEGGAGDMGLLFIVALIVGALITAEVPKKIGDAAGKLVDEIAGGGKQAN